MLSRRRSANCVPFPERLVSGFLIQAITAVRSRPRVQPRDAAALTFPGPAEQERSAIGLRNRSTLSYNPHANRVVDVTARPEAVGIPINIETK